MPDSVLNSVFRPKPVFESEHYIIEADGERSFARVLWKQKITDEELRQGALKLHLFLLESKLENLLSNSQGLASLSPATKNWLADQYYETLMLTSIRRLARVMPSNLFHQIALESVIARAAAKKNLSFAVRSFSKEEEALRWLQS